MNRCYEQLNTSSEASGHSTHTGGSIHQISCTCCARAHCGAPRQASISAGMAEATSGSPRGGPPVGTASASPAAFTGTSAKTRPAATPGPRGRKRCSSSQQGWWPQGPPPHPGDHLRLPCQPPLVDQSIIRSNTFPPAEGSVAGGTDPLMTARASTAAHMHGAGPGSLDAAASRTDVPAAFGSGAPLPPAQLWGGEVTCGVNRQIGARVAIRACVRALAAAYGPWVPSDVMQCLCMSNADHMADLQRAFPDQAADIHGAEGEMRDAEGFAYHTAVTEALGFVLSELRDRMRDMAGLMNVMVRAREGPGSCPGFSLLFIRHLKVLGW